MGELSDRDIINFGGVGGEGVSKISLNQADFSDSYTAPNWSKYNYRVNWSFSELFYCF